MTGKDNRRYTRILMAVEAEMTEISSGEKRNGKTECVSMKGFFVDCDHPFSMDTDCNVTLFIGGRDGGLRVEVKAKVSFVDESGAGFEISSHLFMESYDHLHRLVLYNAADDVDKVEDEIEKHIKEKQF